MAQIRVGSTPLFKGIELSGEYKGATVYIKDESKNPFGTFKDRRCAALLEHNKDKQNLIFVHVTSGNSGYSLGMLAADEETRACRDIRIVNIVGKDIPPIVKAKLETCSIVHQMDLTDRIVTRDELIAIAKKLTCYNGPEQNILTVEDFDVANGYGGIIDEIAASGIKPRYIFCPVGEGELLTELVKRATTVWPEDTPTIIGATIPQNVILKTTDFIKRLRRSVADKLRNGYSKFKPLVQRYIQEERAQVLKIKERDIVREYHHLNDIGINCEPSAAAAFAGARAYPGLREENTVIIINTGKGIYDTKAVDRFWHARVRQGMIYAGIALAGAALALLAYVAYVAPRQTIHDVFRGKLEAETTYYASDRTKTGIKMLFISKEEILEMCRTIPRKNCKKVDTLLDFTEKELAFYVTYKSWEEKGNLLKNMADTDRFRGELETLATYYARHGKSTEINARPLTYDELLQVCATIPDKKCESGPHQIVNSLTDFTDVELAFYALFSEWEKSGDWIGMQICGDLIESWRKGWFRIESKLNGELEIIWRDPPKETDRLKEFCDKHPTNFCP